MHILAQIAPERSTQYADLATLLAPYEIQLSPLVEGLVSYQPLELGRQAYLLLEYEMDSLSETQAAALGDLALTSLFFDYELPAEEAADQRPMLRPLDLTLPENINGLGRDLPAIRRYKGKTNERFTHFMLNLAKHASRFSERSWSELRVFDPLMGGGTTLLTALMLGADVAGVDRDQKAVASTASFLKQYCREMGVSCTGQEARLKRLGRRTWLGIGRKETQQQCVMASGKTVASGQLISGFKKPHLIVGDLPYGIQHDGQLEDLLYDSLPVWAHLLSDGGAITLAWDASRFSREHMIDLAETAAPLLALDEHPWNALQHRVDRNIKQRDVITLRHAP